MNQEKPIQSFQIQEMKKKKVMMSELKKRKRMMTTDINMEERVKIT